MYTPTDWKDKAVEYPHRYEMTQGEAAGIVYLKPAPGEVDEPGTPVCADNLNNIEQGIVQQEKRMNELKIGGRNLFKPTLTQANNVQIYMANYDAILPCTSDTDTYFRMPLYDELAAGETYTLSFDCSGVIDGVVWQFTINNSNEHTFIINNGKNVFTFTTKDNLASPLLIDDNSRPDNWTSVQKGHPIILTNLKLEKGNMATDFAPAPESELKTREVEFLGWSVPDEMPFKNYIDEDGNFHRRVGRIDLGSIEWNKTTVEGVYFAGIDSTLAPKENGYICYNTKYKMTNAPINLRADKTISVANSGFSVVAGNTYLKSSSYTTAAQLKNDLTGEYLYYELAVEEIIKVGNEKTKQLDSNVDDCLKKTGGTIEGDIKLLGGVMSDAPKGTDSSKVVIIPTISYSMLGTNTDTVKYFKELTKWICTNYANTSHTTFIGTEIPNSKYFMAVNIYNTSDVDSDGYPKYASGFAAPLLDTPIYFGFNKYNFYYGRTASQEKLADYLQLSGGKLTGEVLITGDAVDKRFKTRNITGITPDGSAEDALYLQYAVNKKVIFGNEGKHYISEDGSYYSGRASVADAANGINFTSGDEIRFIQPSWTDKRVLHVGYKWSDGTLLPLIETYSFEDGGTNLANVKAKSFIGDLTGKASKASYLEPNLITSDSILNNLKTPGVYYCPSNATATGLANSPTKAAFTLFVGTHAGTYQEVTEYVVSKPKKYMRNYYNGTWSEWYRIYTTADMPPNTDLWNDIKNKPATFTPAAHTHVVWTNYSVQSKVNGVTVLVNEEIKLCQVILNNASPDSSNIFILGAPKPYETISILAATDVNSDTFVSKLEMSDNGIFFITRKPSAYKNEGISVSFVYAYK